MPYTIKKGLDIPLAGRPEREVCALHANDRSCFYPAAWDGRKIKLLVKEGDTVEANTPLFHDRKHTAWCCRTPRAGTVERVVFGERRTVREIVLRGEPSQGAPLVNPSGGVADRAETIRRLMDAGLWAYIRQRPFGRIADPEARPKALFVNAMSTAPFRAHQPTALEGREAFLQAGLDALSRLTQGKVHLCMGPDDGLFAERVELHVFQGPHPAGNTSVHIEHIDPLGPGETVWTLRADEAALIGECLVTGRLPTGRVVALGGPGVKPEARKHYRMHMGQPLADLLEGRLIDGDARIIAGDALAGTRVEPTDALRSDGDAITVLPEDRARHFLGWMAPGWKTFSVSPTFLSTWIRTLRPSTFPLGTNIHGSRRPMILTGLYDRYLPMDIRVDYLVRAILAHDTEEAAALGLTDILPEDLALCAFVCPSKMDLPGIVRMGLDELEREGL